LGAGARLADAHEQAGPIGLEEPDLKYLENVSQ
jgi:hypothetical protein